MKSKSKCKLNICLSKLFWVFSMLMVVIGNILVVTVFQARLFFVVRTRSQNGEFWLKLVSNIQSRKKTPLCYDAQEWRAQFLEESP